MVVGRRFFVLVATLAASLVGVVSTAAAAPVGVSDVVARPIAFNGTCAPGAGASPADAPAATHRDFCVAFSLNTATDDIRKLTVSLPAGVVGDPGATPRCTFPADNSSAGNCTASNQVGQVTASAGLDGLGLTLNLQGEIYNITPHAGEPARLGIALHPNPSVLGIGDTFLQTAIRVRVPDAGLDSITADIPDTASGLPISLKSQSLKLWGSNARHGSMSKPFMTLPTRCDTPAHSVISVQSYGGETTSAPADFNVTQCNQVPWTPDLEVGPAVARADTPGEAWAKLIVPTTDTGTGDNARRQAYLKDVALQLPAGLALNPPLANGLIPCQPEQFAQSVDAPPSCPANTVMGTVEFRTPIFPGEVLGGKVYFGQPLPGKPLVNYISVEDPRLRVKLVGYATIDPDTTAITAHFDDQPQVPFESFKFTYIDPGDGRATLTSPVACGTYPVTAAMTPWGGGATKAPTKTFDINDCPPPAFSPSISASVSNPQAGGDTGLAVHIERPDRQKRLESLTVSLPPGLTGRLTAVPACTVADARASSCPAASQVGTAGVSVGTGPAPLNLPGKVYLTEGYDNAIAGLAVTVDTKVPALDLGKVTVLQKLVLRPDTGIDVISEPLPQKLQGIPTVYRTIDLNIDKAGFMRNATSCAAQTIHATFSSVGGEMTAASDAPYQATACDQLPFAPKIATKLGAPGETGVGKHPPLQVTITQADGEAAQARTVVTLPDKIGVDLKNLGGLCTDAQLQSSSCPANSKIGTVTADTPLLPQQLSGGVYLVTPDKPGLPGIALDLGLVRLKGSVEIKGRLTTTFASIPDVPLRRLTLNLAGGPKGSLTTTVDQCKQKPTFDAVFSSQSGTTLSVKSPAELVGCTDVAASSTGLRVTGALTGLRKRQPALALKATAPKALKELRITLPKALKAASTKTLKREGRLLLAGKRTKKGTMTVKSNRLTFRTPKGKSTKSLSVSLPRGILKLAKGKKVKVGQKLVFTVRVVGTNNKAESVKLTLKARK
jgi:hypothetical protein